MCGIFEVEEITGQTFNVSSKCGWEIQFPFAQYWRTKPVNLCSYNPLWTGIFLRVHAGSLLKPMMSMWSHITYWPGVCVQVVIRRWLWMFYGYHWYCIFIVPWPSCVEVKGHCSDYWKHLFQIMELALVIYHLSPLNGIFIFIFLN